MSEYHDINRMLEQLGAFVAGGQDDSVIAAAESKLRVTFPPSFRDYLRNWGNVSFCGHEYYGLTRNADFDRSSVPNCVWFTQRKRNDVGLPSSLVVVRNINDEEYLCIDTAQQMAGGECEMVWWDNVARAVGRRMTISFIDLLREDLLECIEDRSVKDS